MSIKLPETGFTECVWLPEDSLKKEIACIKVFSCYRKSGNVILCISAHFSAFAAYLLLIC